MSKLLFAFCLFLGFATLAMTESPSLVINLFRHGARAPIKDVYDKNWQPTEYGQLTPVGQRMQYIFGASLAKRYPNLLTKPFDASKVFIRASLSPRCYASAVAQLNGMYRGPKPEKNAQFPDALAQIPFEKAIVDQVLAEMAGDYKTGAAFDESKIFTVPKNIDLVNETPKTCPRVITDSAKNLLSIKFVKFWSDRFSPIKHELKKVGLDVPNPYKMAKLADSLVCNYFGNKKLPGDIVYGSDLYTDAMFARDWALLYINYGSERQTELLSVPIWDESFKFMDAKAAGASPTSFVLFSTHDTAQLTILKALGIVNEDCLLENYLAKKSGQPLPKPHCRLPPFASAILLEFFDNNGQPYVVFRYNDEPVALCGGQTKCPYKEFKALIAKATNNYKMEDYQHTCKNELKNDVTKFFGNIKSVFSGKKEEDKEAARKQDQADEEKETEESIY